MNLTGSAVGRSIAVVASAALASCICFYAVPVHAVPRAQLVGDSRPVSRLAGTTMSQAVTGAEVDTATFQNRLNNALQKMLDAVVGPGRAMVTTAAELDFDRVETVSTMYTQDPTVGALSEGVSRRWYVDASGGTRFESTSVVRANALNVVRETRRNAPGAVTRLSIAVLVDATAAKAIDVAQLRMLVSVAAGVDPDRGDVVTVAAMPLQGMGDSAGGAFARSDAVSPSDRRALLTAGAGLLFMILLVAGWLCRRRTRRTAAQRDHLTLVRAAARRPTTVDAVAVAATVYGDPRHQPHERQRMNGQVAGHDPQKTATVLRAWTGSGP